MISKSAGTISLTLILSTLDKPVIQMPLIYMHLMVSQLNIITYWSIPLQVWELKELPIQYRLPVLIQVL